MEADPDHVPGAVPALPDPAGRSRPPTLRSTASAPPAWKRAQKLWARLRPKVEEKEAAREAADDVAAAPDDELARAALQLQLRKLVGDDPDLGRELAEMLEENRRAGIMADNGAVVVVADRGGVAAGGDINVGHGGIHTGRGDS